MAGVHRLGKKDGDFWEAVSESFVMIPQLTFHNTINYWQ